MCFPFFNNSKCVFPTGLRDFTTPVSSSQYVIQQGLYFSYHPCLGMQCTMNYYPKQTNKKVLMLYLQNSQVKSAIDSE